MPEPRRDDATDEPGTEDLTTHLWSRTLAWIALAVIAIMALGALFRTPLTRIAVIVVETFGLPGLFIGVVASDALSFPVPPSAYFLISIAADSPPIATVAVTSAASLTGGTIAYLLGPLLARIPLISDRFEQFRPRGEELFDRWGLWTVGIAAISPIPFAFACWLAGIYRDRAPFWKFFAVMLLRIPRFIVYYAFLWAGWAGAAAL